MGRCPAPGNRSRSACGSSAAIRSECANGITRSASPAATSTSQSASAGSAAIRSWLPTVSTKSVSASTALVLIIVSTRSTSQGATLRSP